MGTRRLIAALSFLTVPTIAFAQRSPAADSVPRAGDWAAELTLGPSTTGASLLRFRSPQFALLFGADFSVAHYDYESTTPGVSDLLSGTFTSVGARLGVRSYRQSATEQLRPVVGFGARGTYATSPNDRREWSTGIYGELGAVYFVTSHLSLGAMGELHASYGKLKQRTGTTSTDEATTISAGGSLARLMLSVYF